MAKIEVVIDGNQWDGHATMARTADLSADDLRSLRVLDAGGRVRYEVALPPA